MDKDLSLKIKVVSFISIVMVVFLHTYNFVDNFLQPMTTITEKINYATFIEFFLSNGFTRVAVPIFFMMSGYLFFLTYKLSVSTYLNKIKSRLFSLVIPYLIWVVIGILLFTLFSSLNIQAVSETKQTLKYGGIIGVILFPPNFQLWFIRQLVIFMVISPIIYLLVRYKIPLLIYLCVLTVVWFLDLPQISYIVWEALFFFSIGAYLAVHQKIDIIVAKVSKNKILIALTIWICLLVVKTIIAGFLNQKDNTLILLILHKLAIIIGIFTTWYGMDYIIERVKDKEKLLRISANTFFIYCFHEPILNILMQYTLGYVYDSTLMKLITYLIYPGLTIAFAILVSNLVRKFIPGLHNVLMGNRTKRIIRTEI